MKKIYTVLLLCLLAGVLQAQDTKLAKRIAADPLAHLPKYEEVLTSFGERADISPDSKRVAFMAKTFGDAMVMDVETHALSCLTCNIPAAAFVRVMHLPNSDYLLIGPEHFTDPVSSKKNNDLWYLSREPGSKPVKIGPKVGEGIAISKKAMRLAYTETGPGKKTKLVVADLVISGGTPTLANQQTVVENADTTCTLEAQDFFDNDNQLIHFCYVPNGAFEVRGLNLRTHEVTNYSQAPGSFNEPEGIFPDGRYIAVESDRQCAWMGGQRGSSNIDIWKLRLDGTGKDFVRLTHFNDYEGGKAANPVVASNGRFMAFQVAKGTDPPGMGHGIVLYWFNK